MAARSFFKGAKKDAQAVPAAAKRAHVALHSGGQPAKRVPILAADDVLLTTEQVREKFSLPDVDSVYRLVREYALPRLRFGGCYRFSLAAINAWLIEQQQASFDAVRHLASR